MSPDGVFPHDIEDFNQALEANRAPEPAQASQEPEPFRCLGHDRGKYYFLPHGGGQVVAFTPKDLHSAAMLTSLARLSWWEGAYPGGKESFSVKAAGDAMIRTCEAAGIYNPDKIRGRGVWLDEGRVVMHLGDRLRVDGVEMTHSEIRSQFVYEHSRAMPVPVATPLSDQEAKRLIALCCGVAWENRERDGRLLAGALVVAMLCGGMPWRPHLWITGESGEGKTWVFDNIVKPVLAHLSLEVQGTTSEAGIRGSLFTDARPVIFDEAEPDDEGAARFQKILHLARQASSEDGGAIVKGTQDGGSRQYRIRSCFIMSSINLSLKQAADENRFVVLNLTPAAATTAQGGSFEELKALCAEVMTPEMPAKLLARVLGLLPTIRHNAEVLASAIARQGNSRRTGDTLGVVLSGSLALTTSAQLSPAQADAFLTKHQWIGESAKSARVEKEWATALLHLVQAEVRMSLPGRTEARTVSELIGACAGQNDQLTVAEADPVLRRCGMKVRDGKLLIANQSEFLAERFKATRWAAGWTRTLARATGAHTLPNKERFTPAFNSRVLAIPVSILLED